MPKYSYLQYDSNDKFLYTIDLATEMFVFADGKFVRVIDETGRDVITLKETVDAEEWFSKLERDAAWKPVKWNPFDEKETDIQVTSEKPTMAAIEKAIEEGHEILIDNGPLGPGTGDIRIGPKIEKYLGKTSVNPKHYQGYFTIPETEFDLQWLESVQYKGIYKDPEVFKAGVLLQADKYLSRLGRKDEEVQEVMKGIWYLKFYAAYVKNGNKPIRVVDIEKILGDEV